MVLYNMVWAILLYEQVFAALFVCQIFISMHLNEFLLYFTVTIVICV